MNKNEANEKVTTKNTKSREMSCRLNKLIAAYKRFPNKAIQSTQRIIIQQNLSSFINLLASNPDLKHQIIDPCRLHQISREKEMSLQSVVLYCDFLLSILFPSQNV